ncbi:LysR substrate-binding domain-containing protein [Variovorax sp. tm]|uniref:LysR substrate-binding domain-containing protein n=1 Tax=Variovorax atrisoli TaxID=3394203 RepID=UPI003A80E9A8
MDLNDFALFAAVVSHGSFSATGRALGMPKSRISRRIADLERRLGVRLLQRSTRAMHVTDVGAAFFQHCESMSDAARAAMEVAQHASARPAGRLRVSCPVGVAHLFLAPVIPKFLGRHPDVRLDLELTNRRVDVVAEGFDVALRVRSTMEDSQLIVRSFGLSDQVLVASPGFVTAHGPFRDAASLHGQAGIGLGVSLGERPVWRLVGAQGAVVEIEYVPALATDDIHLIWQSALAGVGVAKLPFNLCAESIHRGDLTILLPDLILPPHQLHAVLPSRRGLVPAVRAFIDALSLELNQTMSSANEQFKALTVASRNEKAQGS